MISLTFLFVVEIEAEATVREVQPQKPVDPCQPNPCSNGGTCAPTPSGYSCYCDEGYKGDTCEGISRSHWEKSIILFLNQSLTDSY